jgi:hypothetical protein
MSWLEASVLSGTRTAESTFPGDEDITGSLPKEGLVDYIRCVGRRGSDRKPINREVDLAHEAGRTQHHGIELVEADTEQTQDGRRG